MTCGSTYEDIATETGLKVDCVRKRIRRLRDDLRDRARTILTLLVVFFFAASFFLSSRRHRPEVGTPGPEPAPTEQVRPAPVPPAPPLSTQAAPAVVAPPPPANPPRAPHASPPPTPNKPFTRGDK